MCNLFGCVPSDRSSRLSSLIELQRREAFSLRNSYRLLLILDPDTIIDDTIDETESSRVRSRISGHGGSSESAAARRRHVGFVASAQCIRAPRSTLPEDVDLQQVRMRSAIREELPTRPPAASNKGENVQPEHVRQQVRGTRPAKAVPEQAEHRAIGCWE